MVLANQNKSLLRAIRWPHPKVSYPAVIEIACARIGKATATPHGAQYRELFYEAPVPGKIRERAKRSDGAINVGTFLQTMIASTDIPSGYVAKPIGEQRWERKSYYDLDGMAYGPQVSGERSFRRTERAAAQLAAIGLIRCIPWRVYTAAGVRSTPGAKFISDKCWQILGVLHLVRAERRRRDRLKREAKVIEIKRLIADRANGKTSNTKPIVRPPFTAVAKGPAEQRSRDGPTSIGSNAIAELKSKLGF